MSNGVRISHNTIGNYVDALTSAFLFYKVKRFDIKGKNILMTQEKYYTVDLAFKRYFIREKENPDLGHYWENIVFLELLRRGNRVHIGKADDTEIDFVILTPQGEREYIQVAWTAKEQSTFEREIRPFEKIKDYNKRILLTTDVEPVTSYKGIQKINVIDWLLLHHDRAVRE